MTVRIALALSAIVLAALAYPWQAVADRWILGGAALVVLLAFAWWRGLFLTTAIGRRIAIWRRGHAEPGSPRADQVVVLLKVDDPAGVGLSLPLVVGYVNRFGVRCSQVRVTSRDQIGTRTTWIGMTIAAADNLAALEARSPELPLHDTAEVVGRRLADHLRETGLEAAIVIEAPAPLPGRGKETWTGVGDEHGVASAYGIRVDDRLGERLAEVSAQPTETWVTVEFSGTPTHPAVSAACAFRTAEAVKAVPLDGLVAHRGRQRPLLDALDPTSAGPLGIPAVPLPDGFLDRISWRVGFSNQQSLAQ